MDTNTLRTLVVVAEQGSFAAAARALSVDPSFISRAVAQAEAHLGVRLFERTTRSLAPTEAGEAYLARILPHLDGLDEAREAARGAARSPRGRLRLSASVAFGQVCLLPLVPAFRAAYPDLSLDLVLTDATVDLVGEGIDIAIRLGPMPPADVIATRLRDTQYRVVAAPQYLATASRPGKPQDLSDHPCLCYTLDALRPAWRFRKGDTTGRVAVTGPLAISNPLGLRDAARAGLGPALLADWLVAEDLGRGHLIDLFPDHDWTPTRFGTAAWLLHPSRSRLAAKTRAGLDFLQDRLGKGSR